MFTNLHLPSDNPATVTCVVTAVSFIGMTKNGMETIDVDFGTILEME